MVKVGGGMGQGPASEVTHQIKSNQISVCLYVCYVTKIVYLSLALAFSLNQLIHKSKKWPSHSTVE